MAKKLYEETNIYNIACALREKCGDNSATYKTCDMADAIRNLSTSGGGDSGGSVVGGTTELIERSLIELVDNAATSVGKYVFYYYDTLTAVNLPNVTTIGENAFSNCSGLISINFPNAVTIDRSAFYMCNKLTTLSFPNVTSVGESAFNSCSRITSIDCPKLQTIGWQAFYYMSKLESVYVPEVTRIEFWGLAYASKLQTLDLPKVSYIAGEAFINSGLNTLILRNTSVVDCESISCLNSTPIKSGNGYIYVPSSLLSAYQNHDVWNGVSEQFRALENYTIDGTITGPLDSTKI